MRRVGFLIDQIDLHGASKELTDELVDLSKRYGILTPYTAFLADENVPIHELSMQYRRAGEELDRLSEVQGQSGVAQRAYKADLQTATRFALPAQRPSSEAALAAGGFGGRGPGQADRGGIDGMGMAGMMMGRAPAAGAAPVTARDAEGREQVIGNVRRVGDKTFYRRGGRWVDASVTEEEEKKAKPIEQFSDAYFKLAEGQSAEMNQYLTFEEPVTVKLGGQVYNIERPKSD